MYLNFDGYVLINVSEIMSIVPSFDSHSNYGKYQAAIVITGKAGDKSTYIISGNFRGSPGDAKEEARLAIINAFAKATL